jgi:phospholipid/cholesterol/gamma-HCH transport system substrate-binding protein
MKSERSRNLIVGFVTLAAMVGLVVLLLLFGYVPKFMQSGYFVTLELTEASGLNPGSRVELAGLAIGQVETIEFKEPVSRGVDVRMRIREDVRIPVDAVPQVDVPLLGGSPAIQFLVPGETAPEGGRYEYLSRDGDAVVSGKLGALAGAFGELEQMSARFDELSRQWTVVGRQVQAMLSPQDLAAVEAGDVPGNAATVMARLDRRLHEARQVLAGVDDLVNDPQLRDDVRATAANARQASGDLARSFGSLERRYVALADDLAVAIAEMNTLLKQANTGEGSVGRALNDPTLYNNLDGATKRIGAAADEMKLLIEKWKAEGVPVKL